MGDSITLGGTDRVLNSATVQFYNRLDAKGTFSATMSFYEAGSPAGAPIGGPYIVNDIPGVDIYNVTFTNLNLLVPDNLVFVVGISNVKGNIDLGLNDYTAHSPGSSDDSAIVVNNGSNFVTGFVSIVGGTLIGVLAIARKRNAS